MPPSGEDPLVASLLAAVTAAPGDLPLRVHVAGVLLERGRAAEALEHCAMVLRLDATHAEALALLRRASAALAGETSDHTRPGRGTPPTPGRTTPDGPAAGLPGRPEPDDDFDWEAAEAEVGDLVEPAFVQGVAPDPVYEDIEAPTVRLADVGGMEQVKQRLEMAFLGPMRNPELAKAYGKSLAGGLLLYGPPGCGKTFIAKAVAGELGARFYPVGLADVLDMYIGQSERNLRDIFDTARRNAPCVLFLDEVDALGQKRSQLRSHSAMRTTVNQLLYEMDSVASSNEGVFVLAATNHPWDVDTALRRPGRFDRMLLVLPPDAPARE
ncbi:MAG TPA: ATP-binding protein, partial [Cryptosporangiaceae bacterium]|nr:ATP-binding protein [Cryptosporangiaceae bacterium]